MSLIEIEDVIPLAGGSEHLAGASVEVPARAAELDRWWIPISGWVLGRDAPVQTVEVVHQHVPLRSVPAGLERLDVGWSYPDVAHAANSGFNLRTAALGLPETFVLRLEAGFADGHRVPFALIRGRRRALSIAPATTLHPIAVTGLGRCGSTLAMAMLAGHPQVVAASGFPYAARPGAYWLQMLRVLSGPADSVGSAHPDTFEQNIHWVGSHPFNAAPLTDTPAAGEWLGCVYPEQLASFCAWSADALYQRVAADQGRTRARYWAEKHEPGAVPRLLSELDGDGRELLLVRDFRDMACSMLEFARRRGQAHGATDEEFIVSLAPAVARLVAYASERGERAHVVRYEELVTEPRETLAGILAHLELDAGDALLDELVGSATAASPELTAHRTTPDAEASIGRHTEELSPEAAEAAEAAFGPALDTFGYQRSAWIAPARS